MNAERRVGLSLKWKTIILGIAGFYFMQTYFLKGLEAHHTLVALLIAILVWKASREFLSHWWPFMLVWVLYDLTMRGIAQKIAGRVNVKMPYKIEEFLFSDLFQGKIPPFWFQDLRGSIDGTYLKVGLDVLSSVCYSLHMIFPLIAAWVLWRRVENRKLFRQFALIFAAVSLMAFLTYYLYPTAPPWYVYRYGFKQPHLSFYAHSEASLADTDKFLGFPLFQFVYDNLNSNQFAAIPSLHAAYPIIIAIFAYKKYKNASLPITLYPAGVWFSAVYLNHHYIIDLLIALLYVIIAHLAIGKARLSGSQVHLLPFQEKSSLKAE